MSANKSSKVHTKASVITPIDDFGPLDKKYKSKSARAHFEELVKTHRDGSSKESEALGRLDRISKERGSISELISNIRSGNLMPTKDVLHTLRKINFDHLYSYVSTDEGRNVVYNLEKVNISGSNMIEEINGDDDIQQLVKNLVEVNKKTRSKQKSHHSKSKDAIEGAKESASGLSKDIMIIIRGIGASESFRKSITDITRLISEVIRKAAPKPQDAKPRDAAADSIVDELKIQMGNVGAAAYDAALPYTKEVRSGRMTASQAAKAIISSSSGKTGNLLGSIMAVKLSRDQLKPLIERLRDIVNEIRSDDTVREAFESLNNIISRAYDDTVRTVKVAKDHSETHPAMTDLCNAKTNIQNILSRLGGGFTVDNIFKAVIELGKHCYQSKDIQNYLRKIRKFGAWAMETDADNLITDDFTNRGTALIQDGRSLLSSKDNENIETINKEMQMYASAVRGNFKLTEYHNSLKTLVASVTGSGLQGSEKETHIRALKDDLMQSLPYLIQTIRYIPLPRIEGMNKEYEFAADNLVLDMKRFVPRHMSFDYHTDYYPRAQLFHDEHKSRSQKGFNSMQFFYIKLTGCNCSIRDAAFYAKKRRGMVRFSERGMCDFILGGRGVDVTIKVRKLHDSEKTVKELSNDIKEPRKKDAEESSHGDGVGSLKSRDDKVGGYVDRHFDIVGVEVRVHNLDILTRNVKHRKMDNMAKPFLKKVVKRKLETKITNALINGLGAADSFLSKHINLGAKAVVIAGASTKRAIKDGAKKLSVPEKVKRKGEHKSKPIKEEGVQNKSKDSDDSSLGEYRDEKRSNSITKGVKSGDANTEPSSVELNSTSNTTIKSRPKV